MTYAMVSLPRRDLVMALTPLVDLVEQYNYQVNDQGGDRHQRGLAPREVDDLALQLWSQFLSLWFTTPNIDTIKTRWRHLLATRYPDFWSWLITRPRRDDNRIVNAMVNLAEFRQWVFWLPAPKETEAITSVSLTIPDTTADPHQMYFIVDYRVGAVEKES